MVTSPYCGSTTKSSALGPEASLQGGCLLVLLEYGVTFSKKQAESLGLDWKAAYMAMLDDLKVRKLRIPAYWDEIEATNNVYFWDDLDWQIEKASEKTPAMNGRASAASWG